MKFDCAPRPPHYDVFPTAISAYKFALIWQITIRCRQNENIDTVWSTEIVPDTVWSTEIVPRGGPPLKMGCPPLEFINQRGGPPLDFINIQPPKRGSAARIHQHTAPQRGSAARIHQHIAPKWGSTSRIHKHQPKNGGLPLGIISMDLAVQCRYLSEGNHQIPI